MAPEIGSLYDALRAPMLASPDSLIGQLDYIRERWAPYLGGDLKRILLAIDVLREEDLAIWMRFNPPGPDQFRHGPSWGSMGFEGDEYIGFDELRRRRYAHDYQAPLDEYEAFSADQAWMPNVVLIAKSTYVWLEQLSKKYLRHIHRLDQIPDEELQLLAVARHHRPVADRPVGAQHRIAHHQAPARPPRRGRLRLLAQELRHRRGPRRLGGLQPSEAPRRRLRPAPGQRHGAEPHGHRLAVGDRASRLVPASLGEPVPRLQLQRAGPLHRQPRRDQDRRPLLRPDRRRRRLPPAPPRRRNETRYVYHGNDGTTFAWNDTAQLDYSKAEVREHVIQTILHVARLFPIIRFDAAMVLAKRHVQRLWFPLPGAGGSIPSRAENAMSQEEFDALMPARVLARGGRPRRRRSPRHAAAGRGLLAARGLLRPHPRHASRLQLRLHEHAARRGERQVPLAT